MFVLSNFNSVLEIAFGINALFYLFDLAPALERKIHEECAECAELAKRKAEVTGDSSCYPLGLVLGSTFMCSAELLKWLSVLLSFVSLGVLVYAGAYPSTVISWHWVAAILVGLVAPVPLLAQTGYLIAKWEIWSYKQVLDQEIMNAQMLKANSASHAERNKKEAEAEQS